MREKKNFIYSNNTRVPTRTVRMTFGIFDTIGIGQYTPYYQFLSFSKTRMNILKIFSFIRLLLISYTPDLNCLDYEVTEYILYGCFYDYV